MDKLHIVGRDEHLQKPPVDPGTLVHRQLQGGDFWRKIPAYRDIDEATFLDHKWQSKHTIIKPDKLLDVVQELVTPGFIATRARGFIGRRWRCGSRRIC
jgi:lysine 2,3-aminomutase